MLKAKKILCTCILTIFFPQFFTNSRSMQAHVHPFTHIGPTPTMLSLFLGCHHRAAWVAAVIYQWRLIYQKCQQHLLLHHAVTMETRGGGQPEIYLSFAPCARSLMAHANQCQSMPLWIGKAIHHNGWTAVPSGQVSHMEQGWSEQQGSCREITF